MKTLLTFALATLMFASCNQPKEQNTATESSTDAITELMMSRRSIRNYKDSLISRETLDDKMAFSEGYELLYCIALGYPDETPEAKPRTMDKIKYVE